MATRPPLPHAQLALEVLADFKVQRIPVNDYELAMSQRGCFAPECNHALVALARRRWVTTDGSTIVLNDAGWIAALNAKPKQPKPSAKRSKGNGSNRRMPAGLF